MKFLCSIHLYPPKHLCGAEMMIHNINKYLISKGHEVRVLIWQSNHYNIKDIYVYDGVDVFPPNEQMVETLFLWADVIITHLDFTQNTIHLGRMFKKPVMHLVHNYSPYESIKQADRPQYIVYNSHAAKEKLQYTHESFVLHPSCDFRYYDTKKNPEQNEAITLINLDKNKGGHILKQIAERMPHKKFIGVKGSYSEPAKDGQQLDQPTNVEIHEKTQYIKDIYSKTRILIMPSAFESWGRTATEAMCSGIPVICTKTPGLFENCDKAGIYIKDRDNIDEWVKAIEKLDDKKEYDKASNKAKDRSRELDPTKELEEFELWAKEIRNKYNTI
jgi:glycosyltransferase involved in cell wall biosynthesis